MRFKKVLIIAFVWPEPNATAAGSRMLQLIHFFCAHNCDITMASTAGSSERSANLNELGVKQVSITLNDASFDEFIQDLQPEIVLFDRFLTEEQFGWRVAEFAPKAIRILDTEDLHSLRFSREKLLKQSKTHMSHDWLGHDITKREIASIYRSDLSLIISSYEMQLLIKELAIDLAICMHLPFMLASISAEQATLWKSFEVRKDFMCIGNGKHAPNRDAIVYLKKEIWPLIRKQLPEANVHIYGAYLPEYILQMHHPKTGFLVHGWVANKEMAFENSRVNLAPLRFGAGIKGKLIDAMQTGTPSVTTTIGAEGMHDQLPWAGTVAENPEDFAQAAIDLYTNSAAWAQAQKNGVAIVNQLYDNQILSERLKNKIKEIDQSLDSHRCRNFIGAMLQHQTMASTKYMAKWIAEKNRES